MRTFVILLACFLLAISSAQADSGSEEEVLVICFEIPGDAEPTDPKGDLDEDGVVNWCDVDSDGDRLPNGVDPCPCVKNNWNVRLANEIFVRTPKRFWKRTLKK